MVSARPEVLVRMAMPQRRHERRFSDGSIHTHQLERSTSTGSARLTQPAAGSDRIAQDIR